MHQEILLNSSIAICCIGVLTTVIYLSREKGLKQNELFLYRHFRLNPE